jgi:hypothetical protein
MNDDERMDAAIREQAEAYHRPPPTPRAEIWARIQTERAARRERPVRESGRVRWVAWAVGMAAVLALGVALGRVTAPDGPEPRLAATDTPATLTPGPVEAQPAAYQVAASEHLSRVETFLTVFSGEVASGRVGEADLEVPARQLLRRTRLLRQSPAATDDVMLRALLDDVEFVLLQIASFAQVGDERELGFVEQGLNQRSVLLRLRSGVPSPPARAASGGAL